MISSINFTKDLRYIMQNVKKITNMRNKERVLNFESFIKESMNEGFMDRIKSGLKKAGAWVSDLVDRIKTEIGKIKSGEKAGTTKVAYFDPSKGSILSQLAGHYSGTKFKSMNNMDDRGSQTEAMDEARVSLEYPNPDQQIPDVDAKELKSDIEKLYRAKKRGGRAKPIFIFGAPGIGKTQIVAAAADELKVPMLLLDLQFMAPEDFLGVPGVVQPDDSGELIFTNQSGSKTEYVPDPKTKRTTGTTVSNPPAILPLDSGKDGIGGIIFMDEMNRSNTMVRNAIMQFVQQGRIGPYRLPDNWVIVAAGNRIEDDPSSVEEIGTALADRFTIVNFVPKISDWAEWAKKSGKVPAIITGFIEKNPEVFHYLDPDKGALKYPTPRAWTDAAEILKDEMADIGVDSWRDVGIERIFKIVSKEIGVDAAAQFKAYLEVLQKFSEKDLEKIINDPEGAPMLRSDDPAVAKIGGPDQTSKEKLSHVIFGLSSMLINMVKSQYGSGDEPMEKLYNIVKYFSRYKDHKDLLGGIYTSIGNEFPGFKLTPEMLKSPTDKDQWIIKAAQIVGDRAKEIGY